MDVAGLDPCVVIAYYIALHFATNHWTLLKRIAILVWKKSLGLGLLLAKLLLKNPKTPQAYE